MRADLGIVETLGLVGSLVFAVPVGVAGVELLLDGRAALGATLLVVAALMVVVPRRVTTPGDLPGDVAARIAGRAVLDPDDADGAGRPEGDERRTEGDGRDGGRRRAIDEDGRDEGR